MTSHISIRCFCLLFCLLVLLCLSLPGNRWRARGQGAIAIVSAASFAADAPLAPESIATIYGARLATQTASGADTDPQMPGVQLPTQLGGTTVEVNGERAGLFYVSAGQVNFLLPAGTASGDATVTVRAGDGALSMGTVRVVAAAPALFAANSNGQGVPAGLLLRVAASGAQQFETLAQVGPQNRWVPRPFSFNAPDDRLFLILFLSGARGALDPNGDRNANETVHVLLGGNELVPAFVGRQGGLAGLDQLNVEIPRSFSGRGALTLAVNYSALHTSNVTNVEIGGPRVVPLPAVVSSLNPSEALVGEEVTINGANFALNPADNQVFFVDAEGKNFRATVRAGNTTQLRAVVPFGAGTGPVLVRTPQSETLSAARLALRTSVSGFVETTDNAPLAGVPVRVRETAISTTTNAEGAFILPNVPVGASREIEIDPPAARLPFPEFRFKLRVRAGRDHHGKITLHQQTGPAISFPNPDSGTAAEADFQAAAFVPTVRRIETDGIIFEVADNTTALFRNGATSGAIQLDLIANSRTPAKLPPGVFSSTIAQLAPFGVRLTPGGKLSFPNSDNLPVNAQPKLYKLNQTPGSPTLGEFIEAGTATVSADGRRVETAAHAITETSIYFVAVPRPLTSLIGRVVEIDGKPVREAQVSARGQEVATDGLGQFVLLNVPAANANELLAVEASFQRPGGRVDRGLRSGIAPVLNGVTRVTPDLLLSSPATSPNRPPTLIAPPALSVMQNTALDVAIFASDPDAGQTLQLTVTGAPFAAVVQNAGNYFLRLTPDAGTAGSYSLTLRAADNVGLSATRTVALTVFANRAPTLFVPGAQTTTVGQTLSFNLSATDPDAGQTLTFTAANLPSGATLQASATSARFNWTPSASQTGVFTVSFTVSDNGTPVLSDTEAVTINVSGGASQWMQTPGPTGGSVTALAPGFAAAFAGGVYRRSGAGWSYAGLRLTDPRALLTRDSVVLAGVAGGVLRSTDNGASWTVVNTGLGNTDVRTLLDTGTTIYAGTANGVYRSTDGGTNWSAANTGLSNQVVRKLLFISSNNFFAGTEAGVFYSTDNGTSWTALNTGLTNLTINALAYDGQNIFAGSYGGGVFRLVNGTSWSAVNAGLGNLLVLSLTANLGGLFAGTDSGGVYRSTNGGAGWTAVNTGLGSLIVRVLFASGSTLYAAGDGGIYLSFDNGGTWAADNAGLTATFPIALAARGSNIFCTTYQSGLYRSPDNGATWLPANLPIRASWYPTVAVSDTSVFAGNYGLGVFRSTDNGVNWTAVNTGLGNLAVFALLVNGTNVYAGTDNGVYLSTNNAASWTAANAGITGRSIRALALSGGSLLAASPFNSTVYRSTDNGASWTPANTGLGNVGVGSFLVNGGNVFAGTDGGVYRSSDNGQSWTLANSGIGGLGISSFAANGTELYTATAGGGVFVSTNNGASWTPFNTGLNSFQLTGLLVNDSRLFVGVVGNSVFVRQLQ